MGEMTRAFDWSSTPMGEKGQWPQSLRTAVSMVMEAALPMALLWGPLPPYDIVRHLTGVYWPRRGSQNEQEKWPWSLVGQA